MATNLTNFLLSLGDNPQRLQAFKQNPVAVMKTSKMPWAYLLVSLFLLEYR